MANVALSTLCCERANLASSERLPPSTALPMLSRLKPRSQLVLTRELELRRRESTEWWRALERCLLQRLKGRQSRTAAGSLWNWEKNKIKLAGFIWIAWTIVKGNPVVLFCYLFGFFYLSVLETVWTHCAGVVVNQMSFNIDDIRPCSMHPDNIKSLSCKVVPRNKRSFLTFCSRANPTALHFTDLQDHWHSQRKQREVAPKISCHWHGCLDMKQHTWGKKRSPGQSKYYTKLVPTTRIRINLSQNMELLPWTLFFFQLILFFVLTFCANKMPFAFNIPCFLTKRPQLPGHKL